MEKIYEILPEHMKRSISVQEWIQLYPEEIRFRIGQPIVIETAGKEYFISAKTQTISCDLAHAVLTTMTDIENVLSYVSQNSLYAYQEEIKNGFITYYGGHRVGMSGKAVLEAGKVKSLSKITFLNIRIAREYPKCANRILSCLWEEERFVSTLIFSVPGAGKTTLLRECIRLLSDGDDTHAGKKISLIDERGEIAGCVNGVPQRKIGMRTDVLDGVKKSEGMMYMLRAMSPEIIAVDEIGTSEDFEAMDTAINSGCQILSTIHAGNIEELLSKKQIDHWYREQKFQRYVQIQKSKEGGRMFHVYDACLQCLC